MVLTSELLYAVVRLLGSQNGDSRCVIWTNQIAIILCDVNYVHGRRGERGGGGGFTSTGALCRPTRIRKHSWRSPVGGTSRKVTTITRPSSSSVEHFIVREMPRFVAGHHREDPQSRYTRDTLNSGNELERACVCVCLRLARSQELYYWLVSRGATARRPRWSAACTRARPRWSPGR